MRSILRHSLSLLAFAVIATAWPIAAQLPLECQVIEPSADPPPADLIDHCRQFVQLPQAVAPVSPTDMADGVNNLNSTANNCSSLTLNARELVTAVGMLPSPRQACDFADNDFTKLYCFDTAIPSNLSRIDPSTCVETAIGIGSNTGTFISGLAWDAAALGLHLSSTAPSHFPRLLAIAVPGPFFFCGDVPEELKQATEQMQLGAEFSTHAFGFDR